VCVGLLLLRLRAVPRGGGSLWFLVSVYC